MGRTPRLCENRSPPPCPTEEPWLSERMCGLWTVSSWSGSSCRLKIEELEGERSRLEEDKKMLEMQLERFTLQVRVGGWPQVEASPSAPRSSRVSPALLASPCMSVSVLPTPIDALSSGSSD